MAATPTGPTSRALFKDMLQGSSLYMIALASPTLLSLILVPIVTRHLTASDYGVLDLLQQTSVVISVLLGLNFSSAIGYFYFETGAIQTRVVSTALSGAVLIGAIAAIIGSLLADPISRIVFRSPAYVPYLYLIFVPMPLASLAEAGFSWLRVENRTTLFTGAVIMRLVLILAGTLILLLHFRLRVGAVLGANVIAVCIVALMLAAISLRFHKFAFDRTIFTRMLRYTRPLALSALALFAVHFGERFILPRYRSLDDLGIYAVAYKLGMILSSIQMAFEGYWNAQVFQVIKRSDAVTVVARAFTYLTLVLAFCGLAVLVATKPALRIMTPPVYFPAATLVPIILLAYFLRACGDFFRGLFLANGLPGYDAICNWVTAAAAIGFYALLIPPFGITGAATATLLAFVVAAGVSMTWSYRIWPYRLESMRLMKIGAVTTGLCVIHFALPRASLLAATVQGLVLLMAFVAALLLLQFPSPGEKQLIRAAMARFTPFLVPKT